MIGERKRGVHMKHISKEMTQFLVILLALVLLGTLAFALKQTYDAYTQSVVRERQEHLLITSRAVAQNLSLYLSEQLLDVDILIRAPGFIQEMNRYYDTADPFPLKEYMLSYMLNQTSIVARMYLFDRDGQEIFHYNCRPPLEAFDESVLHFDRLCQKSQSGIGSVFRISDTHYGLTLSNPIVTENRQVGTVVTILDVQELYRQYVAPLDIQDTGIIIVKNQRGTVIMHPNRKMLTFNYFRDIADLDELPQYASLYDMLQQQYTLEEGAAVYRHFCNGIQPPEQELAAFSRMNIGETVWFVSAVLPYSQITTQIQGSMSRYSLLIGAIFLEVTVGIIAIYALEKKRQKLLLEADYLRTMNRTLEELHQSREQINHYRKLQTLGSLAGGIVHEFNNLLTPILGYSEFLKEQMGRDGEYYEDIDEIYKAGARAKEIVDQILPFSRKETDSTVYAVFSIDAVIRDATKMISMILPANVRLQVQCRCETAEIYGSATQINQVLLNLCTNAYQAMKKKGGLLTVQSDRISAAELPEQFHPLHTGDFVVVQVSDTGCGIEPQVLPHIFDAFFTTKEAGVGTGLGLNVVQNILVSHGGFIRVSSTPGQGSTFFFYLPEGGGPPLKSSRRLVS